MADLSKRAQELLDAARTAADPSPGARARGDAAVRVALAMHGVTDLPPLPPPRPPGSAVDTAPRGTVTHGAAGLKIGLAAAVVLSAVLFAVLGRPDSKAPQRVPHAREASATVGTPAPKIAAAKPALPEVTAAAKVVHEEPARHGRVHTRSRAATSTGALEAEVRLISTANRLIRASHFDQARRVLDEHALRFPGGALREERQALRVLSLCGSGAPEARAQRERFLRNAPSSVLAERVRAACEGDSP